MDFLNSLAYDFYKISLLEILTRLTVALLTSSFSLFFYYFNKSKNNSIIFGGISLSLVISMILIVLSQNIYYALGLFAALSIIRFRTPVKSIKEISLLFLCIGIGIATGAGAIKIAIVSSLFIILVLTIIDRLSMIKRDQTYILRIVAKGEEIKSNLYVEVLKNYATNISVDQAQNLEANKNLLIFSFNTNKNIDIILKSINQVDLTESSFIQKCVPDFHI